jgi:hypothetical protein
MPKITKDKVERIILCDGDFSVTHDGTFYQLCEHRPGHEGTHREWRPLPFNARSLDDLRDRVIRVRGPLAKYLFAELTGELAIVELLIPGKPGAIQEPVVAKPVSETTTA